MKSNHRTYEPFIAQTRLVIYDDINFTEQVSPFLMRDEKQETSGPKKAFQPTGRKQKTNLLEQIKLSYYLYTSGWDSSFQSCCLIVQFDWEFTGNSSCSPCKVFNVNVCCPVSEAAILYGPTPMASLLPCPPCFAFLLSKSRTRYPSCISLSLAAFSRLLFTCHLFFHPDISHSPSFLKCHQLIYSSLKFIRISALTPFYIYIYNIYAWDYRVPSER